MKKWMVGLVSVLLVFAMGCGEKEEAAVAPASTQEATVQEEASDAEEVQTEAEVAEEPMQDDGVLKQAQIQGGEHDVSGTFRILDDNTLEVEHFTYDGKAPDTYVALGYLDKAGEFLYATTVGEQIERAYDGEGLSIALTEDVSEYEAVAIWCESAEEVFGFAYLQS